MNMTIEINEKSKIELNDHGPDGHQDMQFYAKPLFDYQFVTSVLLSREQALSLAVALLNKSGMSSVLAKKYRWDS